MPASLKFERHVNSAQFIKATIITTHILMVVTEQFRGNLDSTVER